MLLLKKVFFQRICFKLTPDFFFFCTKVLVEVGTKDKPFVRTENSSSVKNMVRVVINHAFVVLGGVFLKVVLINFRNFDLHCPLFVSLFVCLFV